MDKWPDDDLKLTDFKSELRSLARDVLSVIGSIIIVLVCLPFLPWLAYGLCWAAMRILVD